MKHDLHNFILLFGNCITGFDLHLLHGILFYMENNIFKGIEIVNLLGKSYIYIHETGEELQIP